MSSCQAHAELLNEPSDELSNELLFSRRALGQLSSKLPLRSELLANHAELFIELSNELVDEAPLVELSYAPLDELFFFFGEFFSGSCQALESVLS